MLPSDLDTKTKKILNAYPIRAPVKWRMEKGKAVIVYAKNFNKLEKRVRAVVGGPENIRRPLDEVGTDIWLLCDGKHTIFDICQHLDSKHHEKVEPVAKRVTAFLEILLKLNLVSLSNVAQEGN